MDGITCDLCGKSLLVDEDVRYVAEVVVYAAYDVMELTSADLERDIAGEVSDTLGALDGRDAKELEEEVAATRRLDLCAACRKEFLEEKLKTVNQE
jgi:hypothetical protein